MVKSKNIYLEKLLFVLSSFVVTLLLRVPHYQLETKR